MSSKRENTNKCRIDTKMIPVKLAYFLLLGALAVLLPYLPVFMGVLNLTPIQMSIILGTSTAVSAPIRLMGGYLADRLQKRNLVFAICSVLTAIFHLSLYFTPADEAYSIGNYFESLSWKLCAKPNHLSLESIHSTIFIIHNETWPITNLSTISEFMTHLKCCTTESGFTNSTRSFSGQDCLHFSLFYNDNRGHLVTNLVEFNNISFYNTSNSNLADPCVHFDSCNVTQDAKVSHNYKTFWVFFVIYFFAQATFSPLQNILDSLIYSFLCSSGKLEDFGKSRLWGSVGFGLCAFSSGFLLNAVLNLGWTGRVTYSFSFGIFFVGMLMAAAVTMCVRTSGSTSMMKSIASVNGKQGSPVKDTKFASGEDKKPITDGSSDEKSIFHNKKKIVKTFCSFYITMVIVTGMVAGILAGCLEGFFYYFLNSLDQNKLVLGVCLAVSCVGEVFVLYFSGKIMSIFGYQRCLYVVFLVFVIRFIACSFIVNPWFGILTEATQCVCFGLLYPVMSSWASSLTPPELQSTLQCYIGAIYFSIGRAVGAGIAGVLYEYWGPRVMFRTFAGIAGGYLVVLIVTYEIFDKIRLKNSNQEKPIENTASELAMTVQST